MKEEKRRSAEKTLSLLLTGAKVVGANWYGTLVAVLARESTKDNESHKVVYRDIYLSLESRFALFEAQPETMPDRQKDVVDLPLPERASIVALLAGDSIRDVHVCDRHPHLVLSFESGRVLFISGDDAEFEPWSIQAHGAAHGDWHIIALPNDNIAVFEPTSGPRSLAE